MTMDTSAADGMSTAESASGPPIQPDATPTPATRRRPGGRAVGLALWVLGDQLDDATRTTSSDHRALAVTVQVAP